MNSRHSVIVMTKSKFNLLSTPKIDSKIGEPSDDYIDIGDDENDNIVGVGSAVFDKINQTRGIMSSPFKSSLMKKNKELYTNSATNSEVKQTQQE